MSTKMLNLIETMRFIKNDVIGFLLLPKKIESICEILIIVNLQ